MFIVLEGQEAIVMKKDATKKSKRIRITIVIAIVLLFFALLISAFIIQYHFIKLLSNLTK